jgi:hypothetical protein
MKMPKALALAVGGGVLFLPSRAHVEVQLEPRGSVELRLPSALLPFSLAQVLLHFNEAFGKQPFRIDERTYVYVDRENPDETVTITVSDLDTGLAVVLLATGNYGVNYMREFFEASFFLRPETEQFYTFLDQGPGTRSIALDRFTIELSISHASNWIVVAMEFRPAQTYQPELADRSACGSQRRAASIAKRTPANRQVRLLSQLTLEQHQIEPTV